MATSGYVTSPSNWPGVKQVIDKPGIPFIDRYLYLITFSIIVVGAIGLLIYKRRHRKSFWLDKHFDLVFILLGSMMLLVASVFALQSIIDHKWSHLMAGDLCAMIGFISGPIFISRNKLLIKTLAPWMLLGSVLTILTSAVPFREESNVYGSVSYFKHILMLIMGITAINHLGKYSKKEWIFTMSFGLVFMIWIFATSGIAYFITNDPKYGVASTALLEPSYYSLLIKDGKSTVVLGDYAFMRDILPYPYATMVFYPVAWTMIALITWGIPKVSVWIHSEDR